MLLQRSLLVALLAISTRSQTLNLAIPPWESLQSPLGLKASTKAPVAAHVSKIDFYWGPNDKYYSAVQVYYDTPATADTKVPAQNSNCFSPTQEKDTLTLTVTQRVTQIVGWSSSSVVSGSTDRTFHRIDFTLNDGSTPSFTRQSSPLNPTSHTFQIPTDQEFAGFQVQDDTTCNIVEMAVWYNPLIKLDVTSISDQSKSVFQDAASIQTFTATNNQISTPATEMEFHLTYTPASATPNLIGLASSTPPAVESLTKISTSTPLTWAEADTLVSNLGGRLPTQQEFQNHAVVEDPGFNDQWMPASRADGMQGEFVQIANIVWPRYKSHTDCCGVAWWGSIQINYGPTGQHYIYAHFSTATGQINFAESSDVGDAQTYTLTIQARFVGQTDWHISASATYTYVNPCLTATILGGAYPSITTSVLVSAYSERDFFYDSVSGKDNPKLCGDFDSKRSFPTKPVSFDADTMGLIFDKESIGGKARLTVSPTASSQFGSYVVRYKYFLEAYPTIFINIDTDVQINECIVTSVQVVESPGLGSLTDQLYSLGGPKFTYALETIQTPNCEYASSGWEVTSASTDNPTEANQFELITDPFGVYNTEVYLRKFVGTYTIEVKKVVVNQVTYGSSGTSLISPSSFLLTVTLDIASCAETVVTASSVQSITLKVFDASAFYPFSGAAYTDFTDTFSTKIEEPDFCQKTYQTTITGPSTLTKFVLDSNTRKFEINSNAFNQVGTYTVTLKGSVTLYPTQFAETTFKITVVNPCLTTTLIQPAALTSMTTSVLVATGAVTQQVSTITDQISVSYGDATGTQYCGAREYTISSVISSGATTALDLLSLIIDKSTGLISLVSTNSEHIGTHTVTVSVMLTLFTSVKLTLPTFTVTIQNNMAQPCVVTSVQVVQSSDLSALVAHTYTLSSTQLLTYYLTVLQTPNCGYSSSGWAVTATGPEPANFDNIYGPLAQLQNNDFESDVTSSYEDKTPTGWSNSGRNILIKQQTVIWLNGDFCASGSYCVGLQLVGSYLQQSLSVPSGQSVTVTFYLTTRRDFNPTSTGCKVTYGSITLGTVYSTTDWVQHTVNIPATLNDRNDNLRFTQIQHSCSGDCTFIIDLVSVVPTSFYKVGPTTSTSQAGTYTVQVSSVTIDGTVYDASTLVSPSSFQLTVVNPCKNTIVTKTTASDITIKVLDPDTSHPVSGVAFADFKDSVSTSNSDPDMCEKIYSATVSTNVGGFSLNNFFFDTVSRKFTLRSSQYNQIGTFTVTIKGEIFGFATKFATSTFKIIVQDPCQTTTLIQPIPALSAMTTSILLGSSVTQQVGIFKDQVSVTKGEANVTFYCKARAYSILSVKSTGSTATLTLGTSLTIDSTTGLLSLVSTNIAHVGTHTATVSVKLTNFPTITSTLASFTITVLPCIVTSVQIVKKSDQASLSQQSYTLSSTNSLTYGLGVKLTPLCGYQGSNWAVSASGPVPANFQNINDSTGTYSVIPTTILSQAGTYTVQITSVTVNGNTYGSSTLTLPSSFQLFVVNPCSTTNVTPTTANGISLKVLDAQASFPTMGVAFSDFTDSVSTANSIPSLCAKTYSATIAINTASFSLSNFQFDTVQRKFTVSSQNFNQIGSHTVTVRGEITDFPLRFATSTFTITVIDPCLTTTLIQPATPSDMITSVLVASGAITQQVGIFKDQVSVTYGDATGIQYCGARAYSILSVKSAGSTATLALGASLTFDSATSLISLVSTNPAHVGTHTATLSVKLTTYPIVASTLASFTLTVLPCVITSVKVVQKISLADLSNQSYTLSSTSSFSYDLDVKLTPSCGYPSNNWAITVSGPQPANFQTIVASTGAYSIIPTTTLSQVGTYTVQIIAVTVNSILYDATTLASPSSFQLDVINPCSTTNVIPTTASDITLKVFEQSSFPMSGLAFSDFTDSASTANSIASFCAKKYSATVTTNTASQTLTNFQFVDDSLRMFKVSSQDLNQIGTHTATVRGEITDYPSQFATSKFTITVIDPCLTTTLIQPATLSDMITSVLVQVSPGGSPYYKTQQVGIFQDQVSINHGDMTGTQFCGARKYQISSVTTSSPLTSDELFIGQTTGLIEVYTARNAVIGTHTVTITAYLDSYPTITSTLATFNIEIIGCEITGFTMVSLSPLSDKTYVISDPNLSWSLTEGSNGGGIVTTQVPNCGYSRTVSSVQTLPFMTSKAAGSTITYSVYTKDLTFFGKFSIAVTSTLIDQNFSSARTAPSCTSTFTLTVLNPCQTSSITFVPTLVENLVAFAGYNSTSLLQYTFNDTESFSRTLKTESKDFCGDKILNFWINGTVTEILTATNGGFINFSPPSDTSDFGEVEATVVSSMFEYDTVKSKPITFTVTTLGSAVPTIVKQSYLPGTSPLKIQYEGFKVLPLNFDVGITKFKAFILKDSVLPEIIDLSCTCLINVNALEWIKNDESSRSLIIQTDSNSYLGVYTIVVVQSFDDFTDVHPFTSFNLTVLPKPEKKEADKYTVVQVPYFEPSLANQKISQCSNSSMWSLDLPQVVDPTNLPVVITAKLNDKLFEFDGYRQIKQTKPQETSTKQTVSFTLKNSLGVAATYQMQIVFECPVEAVVTVPSNYTPPEAKVQQQKQVKVLMPAKIVSISRVGTVEIRFYSQIKVPDFNLTTQANTTNNQSKRQLNNTERLHLGLTPRNYVTADVLSVQLQTKYAQKNVDWWCTEFKNQSIFLQLNFTDPMEISQDNQDRLIVKFVNTDLFMLSTRPESLFGNESVKILIFDLPTQIASNTTTAALLEKTQQTIKQVGISVLIGTIAIQFVAKKVIGAMWLYACALQIILLLVIKANIFLPASLEIVITPINNLINLSSIDKNQVAEFLGLDVITRSAFYQSLDPIALAGFGIFFVIIFIGLGVLAFRKVPKVKAFFIKIKNSIFWNFLIRYFQASFIGMNYGAMLLIQKGGGISVIISSVIILVLQYSTTAFIAGYLFRVDLIQLNTVEVRSRVHNLYKGFDTRKREKVMFGLIFFIQRALLVPVVVFTYNFGSQWQLFQTILLLNTAYLLTAQPYEDQNQMKMDKINCMFLMLLCALTTTVSAWNTNTQDRFVCGIIFGFVVCLQFFVNMVFVGEQIAGTTIIKLKQFSYRCKARKRRRAINKQRALKEGTSEKEIALRDEKLKKFTEMKKQQALFFANSATFQHRLPEVVMYLPDNHPARVNYEKLKEKQKQIQNELLLSEISEYKYDSESYESSSSYEEDTLTEPERCWRPPTPNPVSPRFHQNQTSATMLNEQTSVTMLNELVDEESIDYQAQLIKVKTRPFTPDQSQLFQIQTRTYQPEESYMDLDNDDDDVVEEERKLSLMETQLLCYEIDEYFSSKNKITVRKYDSSKIFTWRDIWPYHRQVYEDNYKGPVLTKDQHRKTVTRHLYKEWMKSYPAMPTLPLQLSVEIYIEICEKLRPRIMEQFGTRKKTNH